MRTFLLCLLFLETHFQSIAQIDSVSYHDVQMESQWGSSTVNDEFGCFVRFTPTSYPSQLVGVRGYFRNAASNSTFKWKIYKDLSGSANGATIAMIQTVTPIVNPAANGIPDQQYDIYTDLTQDSLILPAGDFYIGAIQTTGFFGIGIDNAPDDSVALDRQWQWMTVFGTNYWNMLSTQASSGQWGITAYFNSSPTLIHQLENEKPHYYFSSDGKLNYAIQNQLEYSIEIISSSGKLISTNKIQGNGEININTSPGIYIIRTTRNENISITKLIRM